MATSIHSNILGHDGPCPCEPCRHRQLCADGRACERFADWHHRGRIDPDRARVPRVALFARLFPEGAMAGV
ncbi:hypothetical protein [Magnetospirillum fulvum]|uniref:hypothetical protein n=1 Tax=Magnetospirillum fulvum TaxID=1082 RepID=UPI0012DC14BD|nr:hypothetical protein [Magnetospirillum fulvum]